MLHQDFLGDEHLYLQVKLAGLVGFRGDWPMAMAMAVMVHVVDGCERRPWKPTGGLKHVETLQGGAP